MIQYKSLCPPLRTIFASPNHGHFRCKPVTPLRWASFQVISCKDGRIFWNQKQRSSFLRQTNQVQSSKFWNKDNNDLFRLSPEHCRVVEPQEMPYSCLLKWTYMHWRERLSEIRRFQNTLWLRSKRNALSLIVIADLNITSCNYSWSITHHCYRQHSNFFICA